MDQHYLTSLFSPQSIVVFGWFDRRIAAPEWPRWRAANALKAQRYTGTLNFVEHPHQRHAGRPGADPADLAIIALPPADVAAALEVAGRMACRSALVVSSGIGADHAGELKKIARREGMHLLGPNCLGFQRPQLLLNASAAGPLARAGSLALVSQSGALTSSMLDWAANNAVGFSSVVSLGPNTAVDVAQVLDFLANDARTHSIIVYLEGISSAGVHERAALCRQFQTRGGAQSRPQARGATRRRKPTAAPLWAATMCLTPRCAEPVRCACARSWSCFRPPNAWPRATAPVGKRLAIVTNGGGPGVLAADWVNEIHLHLGKLSPETAAALKAKLPPLASLTDLIDLSEDAGPRVLPGGHCRGRWRPAGRRLVGHLLAQGGR